MLPATLLTDDSTHPANHFPRNTLHRIAAPSSLISVRRLLLVIILAGALAGSFIGAYALDHPTRLLGVLFAAIKVPLLLLATTALTLPAFFIISSILQLRDDWPHVLRALLRGQAALAAALASFGPITIIFYISGATYRAALLWNAAAFFLATLTAHAITRRAYRPLLRKNTLHKATLILWTTLYAFVGIQMGWTLRPFIGAPQVTPTFLRDEPLSNAYIVVLRVLTPASKKD